jgi:hypothetical protein
MIDEKNAVAGVAALAGIVLVTTAAVDYSKVEMALSSSLTSLLNGYRAVEVLHRDTSNLL